MSFAIAARGRPSDAAARFKKAVDVCQSIVDSGDAPAVMKGRAKMLIAQVRSEQAAKVGENREDILKSLGEAITLFDSVKSQDDARSAQAQRALYRAKLALAVNPRTATEDKLLADAADDLSAALPAGDPLSADRLGRQRDLAIVLALQGAAAKPEYIQKLATAAKQIADGYDTQLHRNERVYMAAGFTQFSANAQPIFEREAAKYKASIDQLALARKAVAKSEAAAREMTEKWRQAEPALP
jgi:hypothetical protein